LGEFGSNLDSRSGKEGSKSDSRVGEGSSKELTLSPEEVTKVLRASLIQALKSLSPSVLPLPASTFYSGHILPSRPSRTDTTTPIDIKHSTYKNLTHFLKAASQDGLIKTKEQKGDIIVTQVFSNHPEVVAHITFRTMAEVVKREIEKKEREKAESDKPTQVIVTEMWKGIGSAHLGAFFKEVGKDASKLYTASELRPIINSYVANNTLASPKNQALIILNPLLNALLISNKQNINELRREEILDLLCSKMQPWFSVSQGNRNITKKGSLHPIEIVTKRRQGNRDVTIITNFEYFFIEATSLGEELRIKCASSTSVNDLPGKQASQQEVMVQGKHVAAVRDVLLAKGVPKNWIIPSEGKQTKRK